MSAAITGRLGVESLAGQAAEAVRSLNHLTRPGLGALSDPAQLDAVVADLACMAARLPQLLAQLAGWLHAGQQRGRLRVDALTPVPDSATAVAAVIEALTEASGHAQHTGRALDAAHQILAHLAATSDDSSNNRRRPR